ncbi:HAD family hydrolase [Ferrimonas pelagia]|uniref:HAD family hydrolase n=1 Tax=Ferrimonas pelagia TaxID=1177826 RepID=A0ABP9EJV9_9GAMM
MYKALLLDLDETLCDTTGANNQALQAMAQQARSLFPTIDDSQFAQRYLSGIYRQFSEQQRARYLPIDDEGAFRLQLIADILQQMGQTQPARDTAQRLQHSFDQTRSQRFDFFPGIKAKLAQWRQHYTLVVITNGPVFSQQAKVDIVALPDHVDHILIGGQEPEQKPAVSIFHKALSLAQCEAHEALHVGDSLSADIAGANASGIASLWISHGTVNDTEHTPTHAVTTPAEFAAYIDALPRR